MNADYGRMLQPSQQQVAPSIVGLEWVLGTRGLRMMFTDAVINRCDIATFWQQVVATKTL